ncbi:hypothetical protein [Anaerosinus massiliensis]|uniref:hypothetical protein n=1 Tax=Massilibacillus massiliensis TaxID=1806837 RepID=UPI000A644779|nr:hypothetical protein [Massilibacillus massiliensis]
MDIATNYGTLLDCTREEYHPNGILAGCILQEKNIVKTTVGDLVPQYHYDDLRRKYINSLTFYESGDLKSISLEVSTQIQTPIGKFPAEFLTFYPTGAIKRLFPLNGKLSGYWSENQENELTMPFDFDFKFAKFTAKIISLYFYETGKLCSLTLHPSEVIDLTTPVGTIAVKTGFSLDQHGNLTSVEPASPTPIATPIGKVHAFDPQSIGIHADRNSLQFNETGDIASIKTIDQFTITTKETIDFIKPIEKIKPLDDHDTIRLPLTLTFTDTDVMITNSTEHRYPLSDSKVTIMPTKCTSSNCDSCGQCT